MFKYCEYFLIPNLGVCVTESLYFDQGTIQLTPQKEALNWSLRTLQVTMILHSSGGISVWRQLLLVCYTTQRGPGFSLKQNRLH